MKSPDPILLLSEHEIKQINKKKIKYNSLFILLIIIVLYIVFDCMFK